MPTKVRAHARKGRPVREHIRWYRVSSKYSAERKSPRTIGIRGEMRTTPEREKQIVASIGLRAMGYWGGGTGPDTALEHARVRRLKATSRHITGGNPYFRHTVRA